MSEERVERLHRQVDERHFRRGIYGLLLITGLLLIAPWNCSESAYAAPLSRQSTASALVSPG